MERFITASTAASSMESVQETATSVSAPMRRRGMPSRPPVKMSSPVMTTAISKISSSRDSTRTLPFSAPVSGSAGE
ncbi:MAG: hypothetical protein LIO55_08125 [Oscillospiraceae bacterium]|nr:hypothetical protein [Oscillospiraceae bacterium]